MQEALEYKVRSGGAIKKPRKKSPKRDPKIEEALEMQAKMGGAIVNPKTKKPKKDKKIEDVLEMQAKMGGTRFHNPTHKYLHEKLSGRGGKLDSNLCRKMMYGIMKNYDPSLWNSYINGKVKTELPFENDHLTSYKPKPRVRPRVHADVINHGGSLHGITHSENGFLMAFNPEFHSELEIV